MRKLVIEYHYKDGDVGAYHADEAAIQTLWEGFDTADISGGKSPSHIIIRPATEGDK